MSSGNSDKSILIRSLSAPDSWPHPVDELRVIETHISWVFLTGDYAYKIKQPLQKRVMANIDSLLEKTEAASWRRRFDARLPR